MSGLNLQGKTAFVTGAARGIGAATVERLYARGANVALVGLEPERMRENAARLGERAIVLEADVTDLAALEGCVAQTVERFGGIDVAVANAGISFTGTLSTAPVEQVERTLAVNLLGVWRTDRAVVGELRRSRGYLLNISSLSAITHAPMMGPYTTAKAGVEAMSDALRLELAPHGVGVGCAYFGFLDTDLVKAGFETSSARDVKDRLPRFMAQPAPLSIAIDAIERGVAKRSARVWAPRWVGPMLYLRGLLQPLTERQALSDMDTLRESVEIAESSPDAETMDPILGVAANALAEPSATPRG
ncbi:MAG TPA: short-chain dehydrogenase/reductase [Solirubrobacteraceae bacterium]|nr:short-chain dehydrogenase/reductase [Solirubrobacteraceae bacterium]